MSDDKKPRNPLSEKSTLQQLATETAAELCQRIGIDGAFVLVMRKGNWEAGAALRGPEIPLDIAFATIVANAVEIRKIVIERERESEKKK